MAQVWNLCSPKAALAKLDSQSSSLQMNENLSEVSTMLLPVLAENHHIIKVGTGELLAVSEDMVNHPLECRWDTVKAKGHDLKFEQAKLCGKVVFPEILEPLGSASSHWPNQEWSGLSENQHSQRPLR